jgi:hypothetical protein
VAKEVIEMIKSLTEITDWSSKKKSMTLISTISDPSLAHSWKHSVEIFQISFQNWSIFKTSFLRAFGDALIKALEQAHETSGELSYNPKAAFKTETHPSVNPTAGKDPEDHKHWKLGLPGAKEESNPGPLFTLPYPSFSSF